MKFLFSFIVVAFIITSCSGTKSFTEADKQAALSVSNFLDEKQFEFEAEWANPLVSNELNQLAPQLLPQGSNGSRVNLVGTPNYLRIQNDTVSADLPYFGIMRFPRNPSNTNNAGIYFNGVPKDYKQSFNEKKQQTTISFDIKDETENYQVFITVYSNKSARVSINSSHRNTISYDGDITEVSSNDEAL
ncbi:DUF4251 domain-containing protein [Patiriisocius hiemis]|uniref:DUF4251 domain-containing protein n=1 Tax=Patiriisocius hiemis TaxID=3075604 RepID=A0ABU2Y9Y0_9FLAO|nr:DUF4251 domain-containing protein [Constantimarinum sp. W242]MDT0554832.1 DUF4251 domain-containing protein [Constantimarinum sp. W242]